MQAIAVANLLSLFVLVACYAPSQKFPMDSELYALANPVLTNGKEISDISSLGPRDVIVAVLDSGVDYNHPRLRSHLIHIEDGVGYDFLGEDHFPYYTILASEDKSDVSDFFQAFHGTHVAGLSMLGGPGAGSENNLGNFLHLLPIRVLPLPMNEDELKSKVDLTSNLPELIKTFTGGDRICLELLPVLEKALDLSANSKARVANLSLGMDPREISDESLLQIEEFVKTKFEPKLLSHWSQMLLVFAAGNEGLNLDEQQYSHYYPAVIKAANTITVGALENKNSISYYSNYGAAVDIYVRGTDIKSAMPNNKLEKHSGTSMASPLISNLAAKVFSLAPCLSPTQVKNIILTSADSKELPIQTNPDVSVAKEGNLTSTEEAKIRKVLVANIPQTLKMAKEKAATDCSLNQEISQEKH